MDAAIIVRAKYAIPRMLDDIEKIHEQLSILEEMISMLQKSKNPKENPDLDQ
jgi:tetrahydromethanopterin S-methyltransferase subunit B